MKTKITTIFFIVVILLSACAPKEAPLPTPDVVAIYTDAAVTHSVVCTLTAAAASQTPEPTSAATLIPPTTTPVPTSLSTADNTAQETLAVSPTATVNTATSATAQPCDNAVWVADINVKDGSEMSPGQEFEKTWKIKNTGTCTWGLEYELIFGYGEKMSGEAQPFSAIISPGESVDVTVAFTAPLTVGDYQSYWRMANDAGANFGEFFYVDIIVR